MSDVEPAGELQRPAGGPDHPAQAPEARSSDPQFPPTQPAVAPAPDVRTAPACDGSEASRKASERIVSVDALRGFDMFWIVGGGGLIQALTKLGDHPALKTIHTQFDHVEWAGFAFLDLIFPLFIFLSGMSVVFSIPKAIERSGKVGAYRRILRRALLLYFLGFIYYGGFSKLWPDIRLVGVLQRIAICYFFTAILFCNFRVRGLVITSVVILLGYWALMALVPVPGVGAGVFEPERNLANYIDARYLPGWRWDKTWDPEGILSTLPAIVTCILGVFAALLLKSRSFGGGTKVLFLLGAGAIAVALGFLWGESLPVIKKIWTSSYVLVAGGYSAIALGVFYLIVDVWKLRAWAQPFVWIGTNSIAIYMAANLFQVEDLAMRLAGGDVQRLLGPWGEIVLWTVGVALILAFARFLYRRQIFLRA